MHLVVKLYQKTKFKVEIAARESDWYIPETDIWQGCPWSPYLFLMFITVMSKDIANDAVLEQQML